MPANTKLHRTSARACLLLLHVPGGAEARELGTLDGGMTRSQVLMSAGAFAIAAIVATLTRLGYTLFVLGHTDDKLGSPTDQFVTMAGVHLLATGLAAVGFVFGLVLVRLRTVTPKFAAVVSALFGLVAGVASIVAIADWLEAVVPLMGWAGEIVAVLFAGTILGGLVRIVAGLQRPRLPV